MDTVPWTAVGELAQDGGDMDVAGRNNLLASFGYSTSRNQVLLTTPDLVRRNHGAHVPNLLTGTLDPIVKDLFSTCTAMAMEIGVPHAMRNYDEMDSFHERRKRFGEIIGSKSGNIFEALSIAVYPYCSIPPQDDDSPARPLKDHADADNCPLYPDTCGFSRFVSLRGQLTRVVVIAYM